MATTTKCVVFAGILLTIICNLTPVINADTPANCTYDDIAGNWILYETERSQSSAENCKTMGPVVNKVRLQLLFPNIAVDEFGNNGYWTIIYNQGFEVVINQRKYFAFSLYKQSGQNVTSICDQTFPGWSHDILVRNWACMVGKKVEKVAPKTHVEPEKLVGSELHANKKELIGAVNRHQRSWTAKAYSQFEGKSYEDLLKMRGGRKSRIPHMPKPAKITNEIVHLTSNLPKSFDWRSVHGLNFVSPIRNQGSCGSCYSFASMAMLEARLRIATNNTFQGVFSPQDVVSCSEYSQGCAGGFPYLIAGKYAQDFGVIPEECFPYAGQDGPCKEKQCVRHYVSHYNYIGGFYGGCNEALMRYTLVHHGPFAVGFQVYDDFMQYSSGVYHHTELEAKFNPFEVTNHAVVVVGYGEDQASGESYWIVKNSWGAEWGEQGYFRIRRGTDECSIESLGMESTPIP